MENRWAVTQKQVGCVHVCYVRRAKHFGLMRKASSVKGVEDIFPLKRRHNHEIISCQNKSCFSNCVEFCLGD